MGIIKITSGGQTGVDRAALDAAIKNNIAHGGWCPKGRIAEDGVINNRYLLIETNYRDYTIRTRLNVRDSDGTLILNIGQLEGGTATTVKAARALNKPYLIVEINQVVDNSVIDTWLINHRIKILNIAGPRESKHPGIYKKAFNALDSFLKTLI